MSKLKETLNQISLKSILDFPQIETLKKNELFKNAEETEYCYDKNDLLFKFVSLAIETFKKYQEEILIKCFNWVKDELKTNLELKPDIFPLNKLENMENSKPSMKMQLGWLKEFSILNKENNFFHIIGKKINRGFRKSITHNNIDIKNIQNNNIFERKNSMNQEIINNNLIKKLRELGEETYINLDFENNKFNIFEFEKKIGNENVLPAISIYVFNSKQLFDIIPYQKFENCIYIISKGYHKENPYHNNLHASDMLQTIYVYNFFSKFENTLNLSNLDLFSIFFSSIIHDYGHPGLNNNYLICTKDDLAIRYNDKSVLENYHVSEAFNIVLKNDDNNIFEYISDDDYKLCRKTIIECVLGTDMTLHNSKYLAFKRRLQSENIKNGENVDKLFLKLDPINTFNLKVEFLSFILHAADISNPTKPLEIYKEWGQKCLEEFFKQGDLEKEKGLIVSFNCDRNTVTLPQSQVGFIDAIVTPLFTLLNEYFPQLSFTLDNLKNNYNYYKKIKNEEDAKNKEDDE